MITQAVMQHFPSPDYTARFLDTLNNDAPSIKWMMLQVREARKAGASVTLATSISRQELEKHLTNFTLRWRSEKLPNGYVLYVFNRS